MENLLIKSVKDLINEYGEDIYIDSAKLRAFLNDYHPNKYNRDKSLLVHSVEEKIPEEIKNHKHIKMDDYLYNKLIKKIYDNVGISNELAIETIDVWLEIFNKKHLKKAIQNNEANLKNHKDESEYVTYSYNLSNNFSIEESKLKSFFIITSILIFLIFIMGIGSFYMNYKNLIVNKKEVVSSTKPVTTTTEKNNFKLPDTILIKTSVEGYENSKIQAINKNDFNIMKGYLISDSILYNFEKTNVQELGSYSAKQQMILNFKIKDLQRDKENYKAYVTEEYITFCNGLPEKSQYEALYSLVYKDTKWLISSCDKKELILGKDITKNLNLLKENKFKADTYYVGCTINNYLYSLVDGINENAFTSIEPYLISESNIIYTEKKLIEDLNKQKVKRDLQDYKIISIELIGTDYIVKTQENYVIYSGTDEKTQSFNVTYTLKNYNGCWKISDIKNN